MEEFPPPSKGWFVPRRSSEGKRWVKELFLVAQRMPWKTDNHHSSKRACLFSLARHALLQLFKVVASIEWFLGKTY
jgi:hypothetical protein